LKNNQIFIGNWENNLKHGEGFERFPNKCEYKGTYMNGKAEG
jgi:hypothetical protein